MSNKENNTILNNSIVKPHEKAILLVAVVVLVIVGLSLIPEVNQTVSSFVDCLSNNNHWTTCSLPETHR
mgnify:CR=1 FL=1|jgi:hypothetical protein